jgi:hypothetical protein
MKLSFASLALAAGLMASSVALAQAPAGAPAGSTGLCKDGSYTSTESKKGACSGHQGVKDWYGSTTAAAAPAKTAAPAPAAAPAKTAAPAPAAEPAKTTPPAAKSAAATPTTAPAAGGGPGKVWVNTSSKVYHCSGTKYYGTTKQGEYMTESAAKAAGAHADHGKACS